jgi:hypothetical protein
MGGKSGNTSVFVGGICKEKIGDLKGRCSKKSKHVEAKRKVNMLYLFQPHQHFRFCYCGVEVCNSIAQSPIQGIEPALRLIANVKQNYIPEEERIYYADDEDISPDEGISITCLPLLIQATLPSFRPKIQNADVQGDDTYFIRFPDNLLGEGLTYATLTQKNRTATRFLIEGVENNNIRAFVVFLSVGDDLNHTFAAVQKLGVWFVDIPPISQPDRALSALTYGLKKTQLQSLPVALRTHAHRMRPHHWRQ